MSNVSNINESTDSRILNAQPDNLNTTPVASPIEKKDRKYELNYINTNARSLRPKITSLIDSFRELDLTYAIITETWFSDGDKLQSEAENLLLGHGLNSFTLNRPPGRAGNSHGGVAIIYRDSLAQAKIFDFPNPDCFEVLCVKFNLIGVKRNVFAISAYMPPGYRVGRARSCLDHIRALIGEIKAKFDNPYINLAGDFNQWEIQKAVEDFPEILENAGGPTRKNRTIDRIFSNWSNDIISTTVLCPLETELSDVGTKKRSDHRVVYTKAVIDEIPAPNWQKVTYDPLARPALKGLAIGCKPKPGRMY